jgi:hypothetical protein
MAIGQRTSPAGVSVPSARARSGRMTGGGPAGNELLTSATGAVLLVLLLILGVTILRVRPLLWLHMFVGMLLIGPVALKLASTGYRFTRYYTNSSSYRSKGPPPALLRAIAPVMVISTVTVFATGVALLFAGPQSRSTLLPIHKLSFFVWLAFTAPHVLAHLVRLPRALRADYSHDSSLSGDVTGRAGRVLALAGALVAGVVLAVLVIPEFAPWIHSAGLFHHDR